MPAEILKAKVCLVGEAAVGKTSLIRRFVRNEFDDRYIASLGAKVTRKDVPVRVAERDVQAVLTIWDVMGEPGFRELLRNAYFDGVRGVLAVADLTRPDTVRHLPLWIDSVRHVAGSVPTVLLGNKADLAPADDAVAALRALADTLGLPDWRTSAKTGTNVEAAFTALASSVAEAELARASRDGQR